MTVGVRVAKKFSEQVKNASKSIDISWCYSGDFTAIVLLQTTTDFILFSASTIKKFGQQLG